MDRQRGAYTVGPARVAVRRRCSRIGLGLAALALISLPACRQKRAELESAKASANQSHQDFKTRVGKLQAATSDLRARFNALPEDLPGLETIHSDLFAVEEVLGVEGARVRWLSGELNAAFNTGSKEQIQKASAAIRGAIEGNKEIEKRIFELTHRLLPFERMAAQRRALTSKPREAGSR